MYVRLRWLAWLWLGLLALATPANAQTGNGGTLLDLQTDTYPRIHVYLDVHDQQSRFVGGLDAGDIRILENGQLRPPVEFEQLKPGTQVVVAINPGKTFAFRNLQGVNRYELLRRELAGWLGRRLGSSTDDLSLIVQGGPEISHSDNPADLITALEQYRLDPAAANPGLDLLTRAIDLASDPAPRAGMERAVLFVTAPPQGDLSAGIETLSSRLSEQRIRLYIWLVGPPETEQSASARQLRELAERNHGAYFTFSGLEPPPDLESYFAQLRDVYHIAYDSGIRSGGAQSLMVEIQHDDTVIQTQELEFQFDLSPPNPVLISPPVEIRRTLPASQGESPWREFDPSDLMPQEQPLQVLIEFPDGHPRALRSTALYVDGALIVQNTTAPFDVFTWDLSPYLSTSQHVLEVEAVDELGLAGRGVKTLVLVSVEMPSPNPLFVLARRWPPLVGMTAILSVAIALLALILSGRIQPRIWGKSLRQRRKSGLTTEADRRQAQSVAASDEAVTRRMVGWVNRLHWPQRRLAVKAHAYLTPLSEQAEVLVAPPIPVTASELTLGRDANLSSLVLNDPSVDPLHARLILSEDGMHIFDEGSLAGTWVNFNPVASEGTLLQHGDLIHLGRVCLRFTMRQPTQTRKPHIKLLEPPS